MAWSVILFKTIALIKSLLIAEDIKREVYPIDKKDFLIGLKQLNDEIRQREQANLNIGS
jgi:hypothetical protein